MTEMKRLPNDVLVWYTDDETGLIRSRHIEDCEKIEERNTAEDWVNRCHSRGGEWAMTTID